MAQIERSLIAFDASPPDLSPGGGFRLPSDIQTRPLGLQHPSKADDLCAWDEEIIWCITHVPGKRSE